METVSREGEEVVVSSGVEVSDDRVRSSLVAWVGEEVVVSRTGFEVGEE